MNKKTKRILGILVLIIVPGVIIIFAIKPKKEQPSKPETDIVNGIEPVHSWAHGHYVALESLASVPDHQKMAFIKEHWPTLSNDVVFNVRAYLPPKSVVDSVVFLYGSGKASANDNRFNKIKGRFDNQLIAAIYLHNDKESPRLFFVRCLNGMSDPVNVDIKRIGFQNPDFEFTITDRQGLCHHVNYETAISLARHFHLPLFRGKILEPEYHISYNEAEKLSRQTNHTQITVLVFPGDHFNLRDMTYNGHR